jgi:hypothetical protein
LNQHSLLPQNYWYDIPWGGAYLYAYEVLTYERNRQGSKKIKLIDVKTIVAVQLPYRLVLCWLKTTCRCLIAMSCSLVCDNQLYVALTRQRLT